MNKIVNNDVISVNSSEEVGKLKLHKKLSMRVLLLPIAGMIFLLISIIFSYCEAVDNHKMASAIFEWALKLRTYEDLFREIGFAMFIAYATIVVVDLFIKKNEFSFHSLMSDQLRKDVFYGLFGITVPRPVIDKTLKTILETKAIRSNIRVIVNLKKIELNLNGDAKIITAVKITGKIEYLLRRTIGADVDIPIRFAVGDAVGENPYSGSVVAELTVNNEIILDKNINKEESKIDNLKKKIEYSYDLKIKTDDKIPVRIKFSTISRAQDFEPFYVLNPAEGLIVEADYNKDDFEEVSVFPMTEEDVNTISDGREWQIPGILIPSQGMIL